MPIPRAAERDRPAIGREDEIGEPGRPALSRACRAHLSHELPGDWFPEADPPSPWPLARSFPIRREGDPRVPGLPASWSMRMRFRSSASAAPTDPWCPQRRRVFHPAKVPGDTRHTRPHPARGLPVARSKGRIVWPHPAETSVLPPIREEQAVDPVGVAPDGGQFLAGGEVETIDHPFMRPGEDGLLVRRHGERGHGHSLPSILRYRRPSPSSLPVARSQTRTCRLLADRGHDGAGRDRSRGAGGVGVFERPQQLSLLIVDRRPSVFLSGSGRA